jgi:hypothetical protein
MIHYHLYPSLSLSGCTLSKANDTVHGNERKARVRSCLSSGYGTHLEVIPTVESERAAASPRD